MKICNSMQRTVLVIVAAFRITLSQSNNPEMISIPTGMFVMGDHGGLGGEDPKHPSDERPLHTVSISAFSMGKYHITNDQYCAYLNDAFNSGKLTVVNGSVFISGNTDTLFRTFEATLYSRISFSNNAFTVRANKGNHPVTDVRFAGAIAYCNWLSLKQGYQECYNLTTGDCDFAAHGYRLPTEAEWEYAAYGGRTDYPIFPWGSDTSSISYGKFANWENSGDPFEAGNSPDTPFTTPVGFYNGQLHTKADFNWPGNALTYQTSDGSNEYGLYDMSGNAWQLCNDWYLNPYYSQSPSNDPTGPAKASASLMPDGKPYHCMRGGNWFNGRTFFGHGRISNRNPGYFRGPGDPNGPWFHIGFRVVLKTNTNTTIAPRTQQLPANPALTVQNGGQGKSIIHFFIPENQLASIEISDITGKLVCTFPRQSSGLHQLVWTGYTTNNLRVSPGCYIVTLSNGTRLISNQLTHTR